MVFVAFWNSRQESWLNCRISRANAALHQEAYKSNVNIPGALARDPEFMDLVQFCDNQGLFAIPDANKRARLLEQMLTDLVRIKRDNVLLVHVPLVGTAFDVNDLGLMAGVTFVFLLVTYWFSLTRERDTLKHVFSEAHRRQDVEMKDIYHLVSATQVLDVPSMPGKPTGATKKYVTKALVVPPVLLEATILYNDQQTQVYGNVLSPRQTSLSMLIGGVCFLAILVLTIICMRVSLEITREWDDRFKHIDRNERHPPSPGSAAR